MNPEMAVDMALASEMEVDMASSELPPELDTCDR